MVLTSFNIMMLLYSLSSQKGWFSIWQNAKPENDKLGPLGSNPAHHLCLCGPQSKLALWSRGPSRASSSTPILPLLPEVTAAQGPYWLPVTHWGLCCGQLLGSPLGTLQPASCWAGLAPQEEGGVCWDLGGGHWGRDWNWSRQHAQPEPTTTPLFCSVADPNPGADHYSSGSLQQRALGTKLPITQDHPPQWMGQGMAGPLSCYIRIYTISSVLPLGFQSQKYLLPSPVLENQKFLICIQQRNISYVLYVYQNVHTCESCVNSLTFVSLAYHPWLYWVFECHLLGTDGLHSLDMIIHPLEQGMTAVMCLHCLCWVTLHMTAVWRPWNKPKGVLCHNHHLSVMDKQGSSASLWQGLSSAV